MSLLEDLQKKTWYISGEKVSFEDYKEYFIANTPLDISGYTDEQINQKLNDQAVMKEAIIPTTLENCKSDVLELITIDDKGKSVYPEHNQVAEILSKYYDFARIGIEPRAKLLLKENRCYIGNGDKLVLGIVSKTLPKSSQNFRKEVIRHTGDQNLHSAKDFDPNKNILNCKNCYLDLENQTEYVNDDYMSMIQIDAEFKPKLGRSKLLETMLEEACPAKWEVILKVISAYLTRGKINPEKILFFVGDGSNGKSTILKTIRGVLGAENISSEPLSKLTDHNYAGASLVGKLLNINYDLEYGKIKDLAFVKGLTSDDPVPIEKKYQDRYSAVLHTGLIFSTNELPELPSMGNSELRRLEVCEFHTTFKKDTTKSDLLTTEEEKSRILNTLLHYQEIVRKEGFPEPDTDLIEHEWRRNSGSAVLFIDEHISQKIGDTSFGKIPSPEEHEVFGAYRQYCKNKKQAATTLTKFNNTMKNMGYVMSNARRGETHVRVWNCSLKPL